METSPEPRFESLVEVLAWRADRQPDAHAFTALDNRGREADRLTWAELDQRARAVAASMQQRGVRPGERALLLYPSGLEFVAAFLGCLHAGVVAVPINPPLPGQSTSRLLSVARSAEPSAVLGTASILSATRPAMGQSELRPHWLATDDLEPGLAEELRPCHVDGHTIAFLQYTSGSTADPKGVIVRHDNLLYNFECILRCSAARITASVTWLPSYHDMGLIDGLLMPIRYGYPAYVMSPMAFLKRPSLWLEAISRYRATRSGGPNFAYDLCVRRTTPKQREAFDLTSWKFAYNGAEPVRRQTLERFFEAFEPCGLGWRHLFPVYGLAEATLLAANTRSESEPRFLRLDAAALEQHRIVVLPPDSEEGRDLVSCGPVVEGTEAAIVDPETSTICAEDRVGEIWLSGPGICDGYWDLPEETARTFGASPAAGAGTYGGSARGFLRTGDLGFFHDGELFIAGRLKDLVVIGGRNHHPQDIEATAIEAHPAVFRGAAFSIEAEDGERLVVAVEVERGIDRAKSEAERSARRALFEAVRDRIAKIHGLTAHHVVLLQKGSLPRTSSGKLQRQACRRRFLKGKLAKRAGDSRLEQPPNRGEDP